MIKSLITKTKMHTTKTIKSWQGLTTILVIGLLAASVIITPIVQADQFDEQINALNAQNAQTQGSLNQLGAEAASLSDTINKLQAEITALQEQINANQVKRDQTVAKIAEAEAELAKQKKLLGENIKAMYLEGQISTLEMLASSKDLSEFVDKEQYRNTVKNKIKTTLDRINALKLQLAEEKATLEKLIADQQAIQTRLNTQQAEQNRLLSLNQAQQSELDSQIRANNSKVSDLKRQQQAAIAAAARRYGVSIMPSSGNGGYPSVWANAPQDSMVDSWGMYNRECVSFAAFKVANSGRYMPYWGGVGNANQWPGNARAAGIPTGSEPRVGSVAYMPVGYYGHVMYVEAVYGDGRILVSQYNWSPGAYSEMIIPSGGLTFIYF